MACLLVMAVSVFLLFINEPAPAKESNQVPPPSSASKSDQDAWKIDYHAAQIMAPSTVYLAPGKLKISTEGTYEITACGPSWTAFVVNKKINAICALPAAKWMKNGFFLDPPADDYMNPKNKASEESLNFRGLKAKRRTWETIESDAFYQHRAKPQKCLIELITADGVIPADKMQLALLSTWYGIPHPAGVPLFWQNVMPNEKSLRLRVANVSRVPVKTVSFQPRKGCKKEISMMKLVDDKLSKAFTDFMELDESMTQAREKRNREKQK